MARVVLENLYKTFSARRDLAAAEPVAPAGVAGSVLRRINLTIQDGEFMVLVGPSGCGKSTLLRLIAGLETLTAGNIFVGDQCVNPLPPKQRNIAMVFQSYALYPHLSVYDNLAFGLRRMANDSSQSPVVLPDSSVSTPVAINPEESATLYQALAERTVLQRLLATLTRRLPKGLRYFSQADVLIDRRVSAIAHKLQIEGLLDRYPRQLSGGQKQRVALGRAMARNPQVFLMDEPLSNLDAQLRTETRAQIVTLQRQLGITTLYVTHDQVEAMTMGDRIAVMHQGQIQQVATPLTLYQYPSNRFVAAFIGSPTMNFIPVEIKGNLVISHPGFRLTLPGMWEDALAGYKGHSIILGIRPEHFSLSVPAPKNLQGGVLRVEALGSETYLTVRFQEQQLQVRVSPERRFSIGQELWLAIATDKVHLFDSHSEQSLLLPTT